LFSNGGKRKPIPKEKIISILKNDSQQTISMKVKILPKLQIKAERLKSVYDLELKMK
jgi:hypothetical protein